MGYFRSTDYELCYSRSAVNSAISTVESTISAICGNISNLTEYLTLLEQNAHDQEGTNVDLDYKKFENVLGPDELTSLLRTISSDVDGLKSEMATYEAQVRANQERRRREEEARRRREEQERIARLNKRSYY